MRREATIYGRRPISARPVAKPQYDGCWRAPTNAPASRSDTNHMRRRGAKSFVDDLVLSRGVVLSRADLFCDLLRLSPLTRRFVRFRRTTSTLGQPPGRHGPLRLADVRRSPGSPLRRDRAGVGRPYFFPFFLRRPYRWCSAVFCNTFVLHSIPMVKCRASY